MDRPGDHDAEVRKNQSRLAANLTGRYDFVVCGAGSAGSVVARRLAEDPDVTVLLLEAGGTDDVSEVMDPTRWMENLGSERDWGFRAQPGADVDGREIGSSMGKVLGGGSSINVGVWARGHRTDWDYFASEAGDADWGYDAVLGLCRRIEGWRGDPDAVRRGTAGPVQVSPVPLRPLGEAALSSARDIGIPALGSWNGAMMEHETGAGQADTFVQPRGRQSIYRSYVHPIADRPNLTVLTHALVTRVLVAGGRAAGVDFRHENRTVHVDVDREVVVCAGAVNSPKILMQSGIGDASHLHTVGIPVIQDVRGVGRNLQDHVLTTAGVWESPIPLETGPIPQAGAYLRSREALPSPDLQLYQYEGYLGGITEVAVDAPANAWCVFSALVRPSSRGRVTLTGPHPTDPMKIDARFLSERADVDALVAAVGLCRELAGAGDLRSYVRRQVFPTATRNEDLEQIIRSSAVSYWHQSGTNAMGTGADSVVDSRLTVHGVENLRVADASIMPRITTGNTMAPCVVIGERAADMVIAKHNLRPSFPYEAN